MRTLGVYIDALLKTPGSLLRRELSKDDWSLTEHLLALLFDQLAIANWQRSKDGKHNRARPKPLSPLAGNKKRYGRTNRDPQQVMAFLASIGPRPQHAA